MTEDNVSPVEYSRKRKFLMELKDIFAGVAFPLIVMVVLSSTIIAFASYEGDISIALLALIGGEIMLIAALIMFGRANGSEAYRKTLLNEQKRSLGSKDETVKYRTGEFAMWKGALIGFITCVPFIIIQLIEVCVDNVFCNFCLEYVFAWAYYPFSYLGKSYQALNFIMVLLPVGVHMIGYYLGKLKQIKIQEKLAATNPDGKKGSGKK